jgi:hypothetical protein
VRRNHHHHDPVSDHPTPSGSLTEDDLKQLAKLLARYAAHDLDQFEHWCVESPHGQVFIEITRQPRPGSWQTIWPLPHIPKH